MDYPGRKCPALFIDKNCNTYNRIQFRWTGGYRRKKKNLDLRETEGKKNKDLRDTEGKKIKI